jgi:hypothetical protein
MKAETRLGLFAAAALVLVAGCAEDVVEQQGAAPGAGGREFGVERGAANRDAAVHFPGSTLDINLAMRRAEFLNQLRATDPQRQTFVDMTLNERNELAVILSEQFSLEKIPQLMQGLLTRMAREFPNQDIVINAFAPTQPPMKIGTARLDGATRSMTYTPLYQ